jgi:hypothetical protein
MYKLEIELRILVKLKEIHVISKLTNTQYELIAALIA